jgi:predicted oxidoreductase
LPLTLDFPLVTNQVEFSVLHPEPLFDGTFDHAQRLRYTPMIWSPLAGGALFAADKSAQAQRVVLELEKIAKEVGATGIDQIAYAWIHQIPCKPCVVVGSNDLKRIKSVVDGQNIQLTKPQWFRILEASQGCEVP